MKRNLLLAMALSTAALFAACDIGGRMGMGGGGSNNFLNPDSLGHLVNAGGHVLNAMSLSPKDEDSLGQSIGVALTNQYPLSTNLNLQLYVNLVGLTVAGASSSPGGNWVFGVIDSPEVNAFSGPNGYVFVTSGAIAQMRDEAELAGVLAHEVAHVCHHDGLKQVQAAEERGALSETLQAGDARAQQFAALADAGVDAITKQGYSQPQELAADRAAVVTESAAGYDPVSYLRFLHRLQQIGAIGGGQIMSTHPGIDKRIQVVQDQLRTIKPGGQTLQARFAVSIH